MKRSSILALYLLFSLVLCTRAEGLNNAVFVPATDEEVISLLEEGTGALLIGAAEDTATRVAAELIIAPAEAAALDRIYRIERCPESCIERLAEYAARRSTSFANATGDEALLVEAAAGEPHGLLVFVNHGVLAGMQAAPLLEASNPDQEIDAFIKNTKAYFALMASSPCPGHC